MSGREIQEAGAAGLLKAMGHGLLLSGFGLAAMAAFSPDAILQGFGSAALSGGLGTACMLSSFALQQRSNVASEPEQEASPSRATNQACGVPPLLLASSPVLSEESRETRYMDLVERQRTQRAGGREVA